jgi:hypothetical protein
VDSKLFTFSGGFRKSGGFQSFILEFSACYSLPGGFQETNLLGLAFADPFRASVLRHLRPTNDTLHPDTLIHLYNRAGH